MCELSREVKIQQEELYIYIYIYIGCQNAERRDSKKTCAGGSVGVVVGEFELASGCSWCIRSDLRLSVYTAHVRGGGE